MSTRIAIIGAGPSGLTLLNVLARHNIPATVYERDDEFSSRAKLGGSLDLHPKSGQAALKAAGVWEAFEKHARPEGQEMTLVNHKGETVFAWAPPPDEEWHARPEIDRTALRKILVDAAPAGSIKWGHAFVSAAPLAGSTSDEWEITFANGEKTVVDLLVGADGGRSRVRPLVSAAKAAYTRCNGIEIAWEETAHPELAKRVGLGAVYAFDNFRGLYAQRNSVGRIRAYCWILSDDEEEYVRLCANPENAVSTLLAHFDGWAPWITDLVRVGELSSVVPRPLYMLPVGHSWPHRNGVTIIGDAAYLMTPFAGKGANVAMLGALKIGEAIVATRGKPKAEIEAAIAEAEKEMAPLAKIDAEETETRLKKAMFTEKAAEALISHGEVAHTGNRNQVHLLHSTRRHLWKANLTWTQPGPIVMMKLIEQCQVLRQNSPGVV